MPSALDHLSMRSDRVSDLERILNLPVQGSYDPQHRKQLQEEYIQAHHHQRGFRLFDVQSDAVLAYLEYGGLFGNIGVGWGKTLITLMIAGIAHRYGEARTILLVPASAHEQLVQTDIRFARDRVVLHGVRFFPMGGLAAEQRKIVATSTWKGCYILPYSLLSTKDSEDLLHWINPSLIIADEAHNLKARSSARTQRLFRYMNQAGKKIKFVALSGTMTDKGIMDYYPLIRAALKELTPLPLASGLATDWAKMLDSGAEYVEAQVGPILPLIDWCMQHRPEAKPTMDTRGVRTAYRARLITAPGVISTGDADLGISLTLHNTPVDPVALKCKDIELDNLANLMKRLDELWETPNGDPIEHAIHKYKWAHELSSGFYNQLTWPSAEAFAKRRGLSIERAEDLIEAGQIHHVALRKYHVLLRHWLKNSAKKGVDTPLLVAASMSRDGEEVVGPELFALWRAAKDLEVPEMAERDSTAVRVCDFKVRHAVKWAKAHIETGGIIWVYHIELGEWLVDYLREANIDHIYCPSGDKHNTTIRESHGKIVVASLRAHGTAKNLQFHKHALFLQFPRESILAEQSIGRLHRKGQDLDELVLDLCLSTDFDHENYSAMLVDSMYTHLTEGRKKVIYANYDPPLKIVPPDFLEENGYQIQSLTEEQRAAFDARFVPSLTAAAG